MNEKITELGKNIEKRFDKIDKKMEKMCEDMKNDYVSYKEFTPIKNVVYGTVGAILMAVIGAILTLVIK
jgi:hypothetical protein